MDALSYHLIPAKFDDLLTLVDSLDDLCGHNTEDLSDVPLDDGEGAARFASRFQRMQDLCAAHKSLSKVREQLLQCSDTLDRVCDTLGLGLEAGGFSASDGRVIRVTLSDSMLGSSMLTLTKAKKNGVVGEGEQFRLIFPWGEVVDAALALPNNRLTVRKPFRLLYEQESLSAGDCVILKEQPGEAGVWDVSVHRKLDDMEIDF